jgi:Domain of unknown function (DUF4160)
MPTVLRDGSYRFFFYSGDGGEPRHIHVESAGNEAKYWLDPVALARNRGFGQKELNRIETIIANNLALLRNAWDDYFNP